MSNSIVTLSSFNLLFFTQVLTVLTSTIKYNEYVTDKGKNISIPCIADGFNIMWVKENGNYSTIVQTGEYLVLTNVTTSDNGVYVCFAAISPRRTIGAATNHGGKLINVIDEDVMMTHAGDRMNLSSTPPPSSSVVGNNALFEIDLHNNKTKTTTTNASTTSTLPMPKANATETNVLWETSTSISSKSSATSSSSSSNSSYDFNYLPPTLTISHPTTPAEVIEQEFQAFHKINISIRTPPGPVTQLYFKASTILGFLVWRFNKTNSGGYPVRSFTAEYRNVSYKETPFNSSFEHEWIRMDPINIAPNVRQMEVYRLEPNTTYEFRIWANNQLGSGEIVTTNVTTLPETKEEDLIRLIQPDLDNFDPRIWIVAVSIVLGTLVILAIGLCIVLSKECYQSSRQEFQDGWDGIELIPNIILNPGFRETDSEGGPNDAPYLRTIIFKDNNEDDTDDSCDSESDHEPRMERFKRKLSVFFTNPTIRRI